MKSIFIIEIAQLVGSDQVAEMVMYFWLALGLSYVGIWREVFISDGLF